MQGFPEVRLRRMRRTAASRALTAAPMPAAARFLWPVFVTDGRRQRQPIDSMPGQFRVSVDRLAAQIEPVAAQGVGGILIFGVPAGDKDADGSAAAREDGLVPRAVREVRRRFPDLLVFTDVCLCAYTDHGHCAPLTDQGEADNDAALAQLARMAVAHAAAGAHAVAPSAMMDGQVRAIRSALDAARCANTILMSYSTKFASAMYGPFREAAGSSPRHGDRRGYQADGADLRMALRESQLDEDEGADILMVKPALFYLDVLAQLRMRTQLPLAAYNVSGEYAMLHASAQRGWGDLRSMVRESVAAISRAGADIIISYWASRYNDLLQPE